ncbi:MAG: hypothetical protein QF560_13935 [SAR324 cluster bacterium]|nr:hypothetical protein [Deltaproteobacteria bacterium]MDP6092957.1 hypothetical protein [SAR324 cluster bacterium]MDP6464472.1 hypothetical protein [SAR324 cluster bacterium]MDP7139463.1 hypothetical protein [SAR324 cluster bacterium]MDP7333102.1 hypothetical protein [SAR324 cluster bacterium]|tara:strand:+ start:150 stop:353 length:204 start_codon:yes stop_codon:yes gene_type:complete
MTDAETNQELSTEEVTERLNALYDELKSLKPYLPYQQIKRVLAELKWVKSMREDGVYSDPDSVEESN